MNQAKEDIQLIRQMMERSSSFLSLSGLSGVAAGVIALITSAITWNLMSKYNIEYRLGQLQDLPMEFIQNIFLLALTAIVFTFLLGYYFTYSKSKRLNIPIWNRTTREFLTHLLIPLFVGGIFCLLLLYYQLFFLLAPATLLFYGLALTSASKYTQMDVFWLGIFEIIFGFIGFIQPAFSLIVWTVGFGFLHIIYGVLMHYKYQ